MADKSFLAWPFFDDGHRRLAAELEDWVAAEVAPYEDDESDVDGLCRRFVAKLGEAGWLRYVVPAAYGGAHESLDVRSLCLAREILARTSGLADFAFVMQGLGTGAITLYGSEELKQAYLPAVGRGERIAAFALSEPGAGSDVAALSTRATEDGDGYILNGEKTFISNGGIADQYVVFARTSDEGARGLSAFVVEADDPGFAVSERIQLIAPHPLATLSFRDCRVPRSRLVGEIGEGFKIAMASLDIFRSSVAAAALGFARRGLDEAVTRAQSRHAFGQPIAEFQLIQQKLADMATEIDASALLVYRSAWTKDTLGVRVTRESSMAKMYATEAAQRVVDKAVQIFGGMGVVAGVTVERLYREVRALRIYEGTTEINKLVIARQVLSSHQQETPVPKAAAGE
jgi:acyl-CoA dehydrogenase